MRFPQRRVYALALAGGAIILALSLVFSGGTIHVPVQPPAAIVSLPSTLDPSSFRPIYSESDITIPGRAQTPELDMPAVTDMPEAPITSQFPVGTDYAPSTSLPVDTPPIQWAWAVGPSIAGDPSDWLSAAGIYGEGRYSLYYAVAPPGPGLLQSYGGDPNGPQSGHRYKVEGEPTEGVIPIPEPATLGILATGLAFLGLRRARQ